VLLLLPRAQSFFGVTAQQRPASATPSGGDTSQGAGSQMEPGTGSNKDLTTREAARVWVVARGPSQQQVGVMLRREQLVRAACVRAHATAHMPLHALSRCGGRPLLACPQLQQQMLLDQELPYGGSSSSSGAVPPLPELQATMQQHWKAACMRHTRIWGEPGARMVQHASGAAPPQTSI
jgi:hypothetical protein